MLLQIREYLRQQKVASNQQIAREFDLDLEALQPMLEIWCAKGAMALCQENSACKTRCFKCPKPPLYYRVILG